MTALAERDWLMETAGGNVRDFYTALGIEVKDTGAEEASVRCFANPSAHNRDDRNPSCSVNLLTGLFHCQGCGESGNAYAAALRLGRSEGYSRQLARSHGLFLEAAPKREKAKLPGERDLKKWRHALIDSPSVLRRLEELRGWKPGTVVRLGVGWDGERLTFPVRNEKLKIAGLVRYLPGGSPKSLGWPGGKRDLFPAPELIRRRHPLFVVEGEPDAISIWSLGFKAVAVPGAGSWRREWGQRLASRQVIVLSDCDPQGRALAARIAGDVSNAKVVDIDRSQETGYDVGDMVAEAYHEGGIWQMKRWLGGLVA